MKVNAQLFCPWPLGIRALMLQFRDGRGISRNGLKTNCLNFEEAEYLRERYEACQWGDAWAGELVAKSPSMQRQLADLAKPKEARR